jgi:DNA-3-methyladenine glycosylase
VDAGQANQANQPNILDRSFFARDAIHLAPALIGKILVRRFRGRFYRARIVETEAYIGEHDLACHASRGRTNRTAVMFGPPGHAYVYLIYGIHQMLNIVAAGEGDAQAVLVRAAEPLDGWTANLSGPGLLARGFRITSRDNGLDLTCGSLFLTADEKSSPPRIVRSKRVGVDYAGHWKHRLLRFFDAQSSAVSARPTRAIRSMSV